MDHDDATNHACAHAKAGLVDMLSGTGLIQELGAEGLCKVGAQVVCGTCLNTTRSDTAKYTMTEALGAICRAN